MVIPFTIVMITLMVTVRNQCLNFEVPQKSTLQKKILKILLDPELPDEKVCKTQPKGIKCSASYIVDTRYLPNVDDIKKDEFGIWNYSGSHPQSYEVDTDEGQLRNVLKMQLEVMYITYDVYIALIPRTLS